MAIYLAKAGQEALPVAAKSSEMRTRFFNALVGSLAVGGLYWVLRRSFGTSRAAALVGSSLLLFSVIRLEETNLIGPHHLMLVCTISLAGMGYQWRDTPTLRAGVAIGAIIAFGALSMTYVIPATFCWLIAAALAGHGWIAWDRTQIRLAWAILVALGTATVLVLIAWPPGVLQLMVVRNFRWYLHYPHATALVGDRVFLDAPRWAYLYWLTHLELPILIVSAVIIGSALWTAAKRRYFTSRHIYLGVFLVFFVDRTRGTHCRVAKSFAVCGSLVSGSGCAIRRSTWR